MLRQTAVTSALMAFATLLAITLAAAQTPDLAPNAAQTQSTVPHHFTRTSIDERVRGLAKSLDLSESQEAQLKTILEQRRQRILQIRHNTSISGSVRIEQLRALQDETVERIRAILNDQQKKTYDPLAARKLQQQQPAPNVEDWLALTRPH